MTFISASIATVTAQRQDVGHASRREMPPRPQRNPIRQSSKTSNKKDTTTTTAGASSLLLLTYSARADWARPRTPI